MLLSVKNKALLPSALIAYGLFATGNVFSQGVVQAPKAVVASSERSLADWLTRTHEASRRRAYTGTFVVSAGNSMASARMWHVCDGTQQLERVETLTGARRTTLRRNDEVITFVPETRVAVLERRESLGLFPSLLQAQAANLGEFYLLQQAKELDRVAGHDTEVFDLLPRDDLRFGYRIWTEKKTGLMVKLQTLGPDGRVLEQVAFSELQLNAPVRMDQLIKQMKVRDGYTVQQTRLVPTTAQAQGWHLSAGLPGFSSVACHTLQEPSPGASSTASARGASSMQWVFSDGLASVSLFVEAFDSSRLGSEVELVTGATHSHSRRQGDHWVTVVGEVPLATLRLFAQRLERLR